MTTLNTTPPPGTVWCCGACGRIGRGKRSAMGDTSCVTWAVLVHEDSLVIGANGMATAARAVEGGES